jgi:REP element-mobilizing transposase RayT
MKFIKNAMQQYSTHNLRPPHDIHYSWTGWPSDSQLPETAPTGLTDVLSDALKSDALELESHTWSADAIHLSVAASPDCAPVWIAQRLKGRLDHALRKCGSNTSFSRKVSLRAFGHNRTAVVDRYVRDQLDHVDLADPRYRQTLESVAVNDPTVDLSAPAVSSHGRYWYGLHVVFVVASRYRVGEQRFLDRLRARIRDASAGKGCALKRVAIMPDHMHLALRGNPKLSPAEIAVGLQEATAEVAGCRLWDDEFYVGTFGDYDHGAVKGAGSGIRR